MQLILDESALHTIDLHLASCRCISMRVLENGVLFVYRVAEFSARVCVCVYVIYGLDCKHCAETCTCWLRLVRAKSRDFVPLLLPVVEKRLAASHESVRVTRVLASRECYCTSWMLLSPFTRAETAQVAGLSLSFQFMVTLVVTSSPVFWYVCVCVFHKHIHTGIRCASRCRAPSPQSLPSSSSTSSV